MARSNEELDRAVDIWKTVVGTQQHFNDLAMRIRSFGVTVLAAMITAAAVAVRESAEIALPGDWVTSLGTAILVGAVVIWSCFYFVDRWWYHELLLGAVAHGEKIETDVVAEIPEIELARAIRTASSEGRAPFKSTTRLTLYYIAVGVAVLLMALGSHVSANSVDDSQVENHESSAPAAWLATREAA